MALSEEDKKKMLAGFNKPKQEEEYEDIWTDEDLIRIANKIMERLEKNDRDRIENQDGYAWKADA